jgi:hypothetical protein
MSLPRLGQAGWGTIPQESSARPPVRSCSIEVFDVFHGSPMKLLVPENQEVFEAFSHHAAQEPFADRVGL